MQPRTDVVREGRGWTHRHSPESAPGATAVPRRRDTNRHQVPALPDEAISIFGPNRMNLTAPFRPSHSDSRRCSLSAQSIKRPDGAHGTKQREAEINCPGHPHCVKGYELPATTQSLCTFLRFHVKQSAPWQHPWLHARKSVVVRPWPHTDEPTLKRCGGNSGVSRETSGPLVDLRVRDPNPRRGGSFLVCR